ncbi:hypothetical protein [Neisseria sp. Ec49-e6-T10]|uniref:hypothetical protein n=1 Tax=Neisseria sp. Ec49-e6-T10 TaxID=3140744 RepID=UPI003EBAEC35
MRKKIRIWLMVIATLCVLVFFMSKMALTKEETVAKLIDSCTTNAPFAPTWQQELKDAGIQEPTDWVPAAYCQCYFTGLFHELTDDDIVRFSKMTPEERMAKMGGKDKMNERSVQCLKDIQNTPNKQ